MPLSSSKSASSSSTRTGVSTLRSPAILQNDADPNFGPHPIEVQCTPLKKTKRPKVPAVSSFDSILSSSSSIFDKASAGPSTGTPESLYSDDETSFPELRLPSDTRSPIIKDRERKQGNIKRSLHVSAIAYHNPKIARPSQRPRRESDSSLFEDDFGYADSDLDSQSPLKNAHNQRLRKQQKLFAHSTRVPAATAETMLSIRHTDEQHPTENGDVCQKYFTDLCDLFERLSLSEPNSFEPLSAYDESYSQTATNESKIEAVSMHWSTVHILTSLQRCVGLIWALLHHIKVTIGSFLLILRGLRQIHRTRLSSLTPSQSLIPSRIVSVPPVYPDFKPFKTRMCTRELNESISKYISENQEKTMVLEKKKGSIYILNSTSSSASGYIKIGRAKEASDRASGWKYCGFPIKRANYEKKSGFDYHKLVETLVHKQLHNVRYTYDCKLHKKRNKEHDRNHTEWFKVEIEAALHAIETWSFWFDTQRPFDREGNLKPFWKREVEWLKHHGEEVDWAVWTRPGIWKTWSYRLDVSIAWYRRVPSWERLVEYAKAWITYFSMTLCIYPFSKSSALVLVVAAGFGRGKFLGSIGLLREEEGKGKRRRRK